jgi:hypothetical protein
MELSLQTKNSESEQVRIFLVSCLALFVTLYVGACSLKQTNKLSTSESTSALVQAAGWKRLEWHAGKAGTYSLDIPGDYQQKNLFSVEELQTLQLQDAPPIAYITAPDGTDVIELEFWPPGKRDIYERTMVDRQGRCQRFLECVKKWGPSGLTITPPRRTSIAELPFLRVDYQYTNALPSGSELCRGFQLTNNEGLVIEMPAMLDSNAFMICEKIAASLRKLPQ